MTGAATLCGMTTPSPDCPDCGAPLSPVRLARCPRCRLPLLGTDAAALRQVTTALRAVEQSRLTLLHQREVLLGLRARRPRTDPPCVGRLGPRPGWDWQLMPATLAGLWLLVGALAVLALRRPAASLEAATATAAVPALALLPVACGLPYGFAITAAVAMAPAIPLTATLTLIVRGERPATTVGLTVAPGLALLWALADRAATITVLGVLAALALLLTVRVPRGATAAVEPLLLGAEAVAVGAAAGLALPDIALAVLAVTIGSAPVAARTSGEVSRAVELTGYGLASCAALLTTRQPSRLSFVLAVAGVAALGIALGPSRRHAPGIASALLLIASPWVRLALSQVHTPEAYTLTLASAALVLGHLHRRRRPRPTRGPLTERGWATPSLLVLWMDGHWLRPLLLGSAALTVTLLGVHRRLQCPLLLGGGTLLLVAVHELAPTVLQLLGLLPRWAPSPPPASSSSSSAPPTNTAYATPCAACNDPGPHMGSRPSRLPMCSPCSSCSTAHHPNHRRSGTSASAVTCSRVGRSVLVYCRASTSESG